MLLFEFGKLYEGCPVESIVILASRTHALGLSVLRAFLAWNVAQALDIAHLNFPKVSNLSTFWTFIKNAT